MEQQDIPKEGATVHTMRAGQEEMVASLEYKEPSPKEREAEVERQEVPTEEAAVKSSGIMKKWHRGRHIAAGRCREPKELTQRDWGSRGKLAAACRKVSHCAAVAWCKRNLSRKFRTQGICGPQHEFSAAGIRMTIRAKMAWHKGKVIRTNFTQYYVEQGACKERAFGERPRTKPKGSQGVKNRDVKEQLRLRSERTPSRIFRRKIRLDIGKRIARFSVSTWKMCIWASLRSLPPLERRIKEWTLWRGRPPPKRKKTY
jgi:hypothetical protein